MLLATCAFGYCNLNYNTCDGVTVKVWELTISSYLSQSCQISGDGKKGYRVADAGTEEMWIEEDGTVVLFYTGSDKRSIKNQYMSASGPMMVLAIAILLVIRTVHSMCIRIVPDNTSSTYEWYHYCRQTKVSLHCDQEVKNTSITTTGDTIVTLTYVSKNGWHRQA